MSPPRIQIDLGGQGLGPKLLEGSYNEGNWATKQGAARFWQTCERFGHFLESRRSYRHAAAYHGWLLYTRALGDGSSWAPIEIDDTTIQPNIAASCGRAP